MKPSCRCSSSAAQALYDPIEVGSEGAVWAAWCLKPLGISLSSWSRCSWWPGQPPQIDRFKPGVNLLFFNLSYLLTSPVDVDYKYLKLNCGVFEPTTPRFTATTREKILLDPEHKLLGGGTRVEKLRLCRGSCGKQDSPCSSKCSRRESSRDALAALKSSQGLFISKRLHVSPLIRTLPAEVERRV